MQLRILGCFPALLSGVHIDEGPAGTDLRDGSRILTSTALGSKQAEAPSGPDPTEVSSKDTRRRTFRSLAGSGAGRLFGSRASSSWVSGKSSSTSILPF